MNPWTAVFQSLHSALIDELTDRHPDPKPILGLPLRTARWEIPTSFFSQKKSEYSRKFEAHFCQIEIQGSQGFSAVLLDDFAKAELQTSSTLLWKCLLKRAGVEFHRHSLQPVLQDSPDIRSPFNLPTSWNPPTRVVWVPVELTHGLVLLAFAV